MSSTIILKNAGGFDKWERAVVVRAAQLLSEDILETENDNYPDPSLEVKRLKVLRYNATTQDIAVWEARESQYVVIHSRIQLLLEFMAQTMEPTLYERVLLFGYLEHRTPTGLYRAVKKTLQLSSKSSEIELQKRW